MKVSCLQENLAKGLSIVGRAVNTRSTLPVLGNILLETDGGRLKLSATNLEIAITCWIGAQTEIAGSITLPARTFTDLVSTLPQDRVDLNLNETTQTVHISCGRVEANINGIDAQEFPMVPAPEENGRLRIEGYTLKQMINQVAFAAAIDDARPTLTGVSARFAGSQVVMAATDGFRLSVRSAHLATSVDAETEVIIPARALSEVARVIDENTEAVYVTMPEGRNQIIFDMESIVVVSQLIDGAFPDYRPIIPKKRNTHTVLSTADFRKACRTANIFARESSNTARVRVEPGDEFAPAHAIVTAISTETGDNEARIDANVDGDPIEIAFNVKYMGDVLNVIETPQVVLETTTAMEPGVIKPAGDQDFLHVIMPMHFGR